MLCWSQTCAKEVDPSAVACPACGSPLKVRDKYRIVQVLGQGGMGVVYRAVDERLGREVALKVMHGRFAERSRQRERFQTEARAMAALDHPGIARIYDADAHHDQLFLVQQLVMGRPLRDWVVRKQSRPPALSVAESVAMAIEILAALDHAHDKGIVHRDINPNNVIVVERGGLAAGLAPVLIDFGLARTADQEQTKVAIGGTPGYAAPEQLLDPTSNDPRSDVYAVAAVIHALVTRGVVPYGEVLPRGIGADPNAMLVAYMRISRGEIAYVAPEVDLPTGLADVLRKALSPSPHARYATAGEMVGALRPFAATAGAATVEVPRDHPSESPRASVPGPAEGTAAMPSTLSAQVTVQEGARSAAPAPAPLAVTGSPRRARLPLALGALVIAAAAGALAVRGSREPTAPVAVPAPVSTAPSVPAAATPSTGFAARPAGAPELVLFAPSGLTVAADGRVLIADRGNHRLVAHHDGALRTLAGSGAIGFLDGPAATARFNAPRTLRIAGDGTIFVADEGNHRIRVVRGDTVETLAGTGEAGFSDGPVATAKLDHPAGISLRPDGGVLVADRGNHRIRMVLGGQVTTVAGAGQRGYADGTAAFAKFDSPASVAFAPDGAVYIADAGNLKIRVLRGGFVSTLGPMGERQVTVNEPSLVGFDWLPGLTVGPDGVLYYAEPDKHRVMVVRDGKAQVFAGSGDIGSADGEAANATFSLPEAVAVGPDGAVYVADAKTDRVRVVRDRRVETLVGARAGGFVDGKVADARFNRPWGLAVGKDGAIYVADWENSRVRVVQGQAVRTLAGSGVSGFRDGPARDADFHGLWDLKLGPTGAVFVADGDNDRIRAIEGGVVRTVAGSGEVDAGADPAKALRAPGGVAVGKDGKVYVADTQHHRVCVVEGGGLRTVAGTGVAGFMNGAATEAQFDRPAAIEVDDQGWLYVADVGNDRIRLVRHGRVTTLAGSGERGFSDGEASLARFDSPVALALGEKGVLLVADLGNHRIRTVVDGKVGTLAGTGIDGYADGPVAEARFARPSGVATGPDGVVYVTDSGNHLVRRIVGGRVETIVGR